MSRAFVRETGESAPPPERMVEDGANPVTPEGWREIEANVARLEAALKTETNILLRETLERDLRYWTARKSTAEVVQPAADGTVGFGSTVTILRKGRQQTFRISTSARDHERRLEACKAVATDIIDDLASCAYQARPEYLNYLKKYVARLPTRPGDGNVLLADAAARTLRNLFADEADFLSPALSSSLKTFLEQHIGLRAFYPEITTFYSDVQDGKLSTPLPLDAVDQFAKAVQEYTPTIFEPTVTDALGDIPIKGIPFFGEQ